MLLHKKGIEWFLGEFGALMSRIDDSAELKQGEIETLVLLSSRLLGHCEDIFAHTTAKGSILEITREILLQRSGPTEGIKILGAFDLNAGRIKAHLIKLRDYLPKIINKYSDRTKSFGKQSVSGDIRPILEMLGVIDNSSKGIIEALKLENRSLNETVGAIQQKIARLNDFVQNLKSWEN